MYCLLIGGFIKGLFSAMIMLGGMQRMNLGFEYIIGHYIGLGIAILGPLCFWIILPIKNTWFKKEEEDMNNLLN